MLKHRSGAEGHFPLHCTVQSSPLPPFTVKLHRALQIRSSRTGPSSPGCSPSSIITVDSQVGCDYRANGCSWGVFFSFSFFFLFFFFLQKRNLFIQGAFINGAECQELYIKKKQQPKKTNYTFSTLLVVTRYQSIRSYILLNFNMVFFGKQWLSTKMWKM